MYDISIGTERIYDIHGDIACILSTVLSIYEYITNSENWYRMMSWAFQQTCHLVLRDFVVCSNQGLVRALSHIEFVIFR